MLLSADGLSDDEMHFIDKVSSNLVNEAVLDIGNITTIHVAETDAIDIRFTLLCTFFNLIFLSFENIIFKVAFMTKIKIIKALRAYAS